MTTAGCDSCNIVGGRKLSKYNQYVQSEFNKIKKQYPNKKTTEIMKMVAKQWNVSK